jgi:hypothetical protein
MIDDIRAPSTLNPLADVLEVEIATGFDYTRSTGVTT